MESDVELRAPLQEIHTIAVVGIKDGEAARRPGKAGIRVIQDRCPVVDHRRLFPER